MTDIAIRSSRPLLPTLALLLAGAALVPPARAQTMDEALSYAYATNSTLNAARAELRATDEQVPQALSNWRPSVTVSGSQGRDFNKVQPNGGYVRNAGASSLGTGTGLGTGSSTGSGSSTGTGTSAGSSGTTGSSSSGNSSAANTTVVSSSSSSFGITRTNPGTATFQLVQPLYRGGRTVAATSQAENNVQNERARLTQTEETVLLSAAQSYLDVVRDQATLDLDLNNQQVLTKQLEASRDRFKVGEITKTDVAQSQAALARAVSQVATARGNLSASRANFLRYVGLQPRKLAPYEFAYALPASLDEAVAVADANNPVVIQAIYAERASRDSIDILEGSRLPEVDIVGQYSRTFNPAYAVRRSDAGVLQAQVRVPLYTGGNTSSQIRAAKQTQSQRVIDIETARRQTRDTTVIAWESLVAARASLESRRVEVQANEVAFEGTRQEAQVGSRTVLDVLDAEQTLLNSKVNQVVDQHDMTLAAFNVLSSVGALTAPQLALAGPYYDVRSNYNDVHDKWFGTDVDDELNRAAEKASRKP